jgi:hypothetical protein
MFKFIRRTKVTTAAIAVLVIVGVLVSVLSSNGSRTASTTHQGASTGGQQAAPEAGLVDTAFVGRANAACEPLERAAENDRFPYPNFDARTPEGAALLPKVGRYFTTHSGLLSIFQNLSTLGQPATGGEAWARVLAELNVVYATATEQVDAALKADSNRFVTSSISMGKVLPAMLRAFLDAGFAADGPCALMFTQPRDTVDA